MQASDAGRFGVGLVKASAETVGFCCLGSYNRFENGQQQVWVGQECRSLTSSFGGRGFQNRKKGLQVMEDIERMTRTGRDPVFSTGYGRMY